MSRSRALRCLLLALWCMALAPALADEARWPSYGGDAGGTRFSSARQLTPATVGELREQWVYRTGDLASRDEAYRKLMDLFTLTRKLGGIPATKAALGAQGLPGGIPRRPRLPVSEESGRTLADAMAAWGIEG